MRRWLPCLVFALGLSLSAAALAGDTLSCPSGDPDSCFRRGLEALSAGDAGAAEAYFDRAIAEGIDRSHLHWLALFYRTGTYGLPQDRARAAAFYAEAGRDGVDGAPLLELAMMTWHGQGIPPDRAAAVHLFRQGLIAFDLLGGEADIPDLDGLILGGPVPEELLAEFAWVHELATTPGMAEAVADDLLAQVPPDAVSACRYLALGFERHRNADAAYRLGMMHSGGYGIEPARFYAYHYLDFAAALDHPAATAEIGRRLIQGDVPMRHAWEGLAWLLRAQALGQEVGDEIAAAKAPLPPATVAEAEVQARSHPLFDTPHPDQSHRCVAAAD